MTDKELTMNEILENGMAELNEKMEKGMSELKEEMKKGIAELTAKINAKIEADEQQNGGGNNENGRKRKIFEEDEPNSKKKPNSSTQRRGLPAELLNELFSSLALNNAIGLLAIMPNGLLARNVQKILNNKKMEIKANKWNEHDCGPKLSISEDGFVIEHSGPNDFNSIRSVSSIPTIHLGINKSIIICYFEVEILTINWCAIKIGFSTQQFPLENILGFENSIGICHKKKMWIDGSDIFGDEDGCFVDEEECFVKGSVVGIGIIHSPENDSMQCFATCNGQLLVKGELPSKFAGLELFPNVSLRYSGQSIRANFGQEKWQFKEFDKVLACDGKKIYKERMNLIQE